MPVTDLRTDALRRALARLAGHPAPDAASRYLGARREAIDEELGATILAEIPAFTESGNPDVLPELARHGSEHVEEIVGLLGGAPVGDFAFVERHARRRAEQHFPLEATLHAYRCGHKVFSRWLREAVLSSAPAAHDAPEIVAAVADFAIEYTDAISTVATGAYVARLRLLADVAGDRRTELMSLLLDGHDESDGRVAGLLREAGYLDSRQAFCVVLARSVDPAEMLHPARARRLADALERETRSLSARRLIDVRDERVTAVFSASRRASGWTAAHAPLSLRVADVLSLFGNSVLVGLSDDAPSTARIPGAWREARLALDVADVEHRVVRFASIGTRRLLLLLAGDEFAGMLPGWSAAFGEADRRAGGLLTTTLRAYAEADMNVRKAAKHLQVHPNTVYARFQRIRDITALDGRSYDALTQLLLVAETFASTRDKRSRSSR